MTIQILGLAGGVFSYLVFCHFLVDWVFQSHYEAVNKTKSFWVRTLHCTVYGLGMTVALSPFLSGWQLFIAANWLQTSHFLEDSYVPVGWWMRFVRRPFDATGRPLTPAEFAATPLGLILAIAVDQIIHLACLWPIVWLALR